MSAPPIEPGGRYVDLESIVVTVDRYNRPVTLMDAGVESLTPEQRHQRWQVLETRFEKAEAAVRLSAAELHIFGARCFEIDQARLKQLTEANP